jgi:YVTN family beta-propeller protein
MKKLLVLLSGILLILTSLLASGCSSSHSATVNSSPTSSQSANNTALSTNNNGNTNVALGSFQGTMTGSWTGKAKNTTVGGTLTLTVGPSGIVQGNFSSATWFGGSFTGQIDSGGNLNASGNVSSTQQTTWQGKLSKSGISYTIQGSWTYPAPKSSGTFSATETSRVANVIATVTVGDNATGLAYDSGKNEIFVSNQDDNTVSVISDDTNAVVAKVTVGTWPTNLAYDSAKDEVFVVSGVSGTISVISDTNNQVVAKIPLDSPTNIAYDSTEGEMFVTDRSGLSVISDNTNAVVANIPVEDCYGPIAYDPGKGEIFVADQAGVSIISDSNNSVITSIAIPYGNGIGNFVYDSAKGEMFANAALIVVISDKTNSIDTTISGFSAGDLTYDPKTGEIFVSGKQPYPGIGTLITVVSASDNKVVATLTGTGGTLAYDSGKDEIISTNVTIPGGATNTVAVIQPPS